MKGNKETARRCVKAFLEALDKSCGNYDQSTDTGSLPESYGQCDLPRQFLIEALNALGYREVIRLGADGKPDTVHAEALKLQSEDKRDGCAHPLRHYKELIRSAKEYSR